MQQYREIRAQSRAGAVWTGKSRRHHRNFLGAYHRGPSSPPLSHPQQPWCHRTVRAAAQPSPGPAAVRHRGCRTHQSRVGAVETQTPEICNIAEADSSAKSVNPWRGICASVRAVPGGKGLLAKSHPKASHRIRSPGEKDGAEIKSSSVAPYGQSLAGGEGAPQVSGGPFQQHFNPLSS